MLDDGARPSLRGKKVEDTIVLFGSAETETIAVAEKELKAAQATIKDPKDLKAQKSDTSTKRSAPSNLRSTMMQRYSYPSR